MKQYRLFKAFKIFVLVVIGCFVFGYIIMRLWNWLMPPIFGLTTITFAQSLGLFVLSKILLGGFHRHSGGGGRNWRRHMEARWEQMSPEERERFRSGMRGRRGCWPKPASEPTAGQTTA